MNTDVVVIGAGCAGLSAAVRLAAAGLRVTVVEEAPRLGGRATAFTDRATGERVDNGQHVLFGCYRETYAFLRCLGTDALAPLQRRLSLTMCDAGGRARVLQCPSLPAPWHLIAAVLGWRALSTRDRLAVLRLRALLARVRRAGAAAVAAAVPAEQTVDGWLSAQGQTGRLNQWLWHPLAWAALNQPPAVAAAAPFVRVLGELFGPSVEDSAVGLPNVPLDELYAEPSRRFIEARGGRVLLRSSARVLVDPGTLRVRGVRAGGEAIASDAVVSAVPWFAFGRIWEREPPPAMAATAASAAALSSSPIVTVNLWFDEPVMPAPFIGLVDGPMHWAFDRRAIVGERAHHLALVSSGADDIARLDNAAVTDLARAELLRALPGARRARLVRSVVVREHRATFSVRPGEPPRPRNETGLDGFYLAGDWTDTGLPATIEGAVKSGHAAADLVLSRRATAPRAT